MSRIMIFANGELPNLEKARALIQADDYLVCADGGTRHALALGLKPNLIVGDLDSVTDAELQKADAKVVKYPRDKNETDLELALNHALEQKPTSIIVIAALGNRIDQTIANLALLSNSRLSNIDSRFDDGLEEVFFCRARSKASPAVSHRRAAVVRGTNGERSRRIEGRGGDIVSLIPWNGTVKGIRTSGLRWPLNNESLYPDKTRGVSNEMLGRTAEISVKSGLLLIIHTRS